MTQYLTQNLTQKYLTQKFTRDNVNFNKDIIHKKLKCIKYV